MIEKFELKGVHTTIDDNLHKYVQNKIGRLDKYMPRHHRDSVHAVVELKEITSKDKNKYACTAVLHLPGEMITVTETTVNMYAAVDIVETKLKQQIKKYKDSHGNGKWSRHLTARFRRRTGPVTEQAEAEG